jgi:hypothetical protein
MGINGMNDCAYASSKGLTSGISAERLVGVVVLACVTSLLIVSASDDMMTRLSHLGGLWRTLRRRAEKRAQSSNVAYGMKWCSSIVLKRIHRLFPVIATLKNHVIHPRMMGD